MNLKIRILPVKQAFKEYPSLFGGQGEDDPYFSVCQDGLNSDWVDYWPDAVTLIIDMDTYDVLYSLPAHEHLLERYNK
mgnify:CR=1 FL=1